MLVFILWAGFLQTGVREENRRTEGHKYIRQAAEPVGMCYGIEIVKL